MKFDRNEIASRLRSMAEKGLPRPLQQQSLEGRFLSLMTCQTSSYYDADLDRHVREARPDWFRKPRHDVQQTKARIIEHAKAGLPRAQLSKRDNNALNHYIYEARGSLDESFKQEIVSLRPDWFNDTKVSHQKNDIMVAARAGEPVAEYLKSVRRYTRKTSPQFDADFAQELASARPDWFWTDSDRLKNHLLEIAKSGASQPSPSSDMRIYHAFRRYTRSVETAYDAEFAEKLKRVRPDWFEGRANRKRIMDATPR